MPVFDYTFIVNADLESVAGFHKSTSALKLLTPPPVFVQLHQIEPLAEGSVSDFTLWFGPFPIRWVAVHSRVDPRHGFTDTQKKGPLKVWMHTHSFSAEGKDLTRIREHIEYQHHRGLRGVISRMLFPKPGLKMMFAYRKFKTRRALET